MAQLLPSSFFEGTSRLFGEPEKGRSWQPCVGRVGMGDSRFTVNDEVVLR
eukprot:CAMPEP_0204254318 /NCGR_PEP_ID=MMETSP0468-20130131/2478_1 /ASSEMBLY_ACC=CAM_ASM_000383 /TAXON_ID=2969 /ORGANISM="Oxyrrhis marina" /LENGTH=49 /DNA_ID= /DNA_START= /DNA_END= /DNA_ORIENTATION=